MREERRKRVGVDAEWTPSGRRAAESEGIIFFADGAYFLSWGENMQRRGSKVYKSIPTRNNWRNIYSKKSLLSCSTQRSADLLELGFQILENPCVWQSLCRPSPLPSNRHNPLKCNLFQSSTVVTEIVYFSNSDSPGLAWTWQHVLPRFFFWNY